MANDIKRTWYQHVDVLPLASGATVSEEGQVMAAVLEGGVEKVKPATGSGDVVAGFSVFRQVDYTTRPIVAEGTVPASAPYTVELGHTSLVSGRVRVYNVTNAADMTVVAIAPAAATEVQVNLTTGTLTFHSGAADEAFIIYYTLSFLTEQILSNLVILILYATFTVES